MKITGGQGRPDTNGMETRNEALIDFVPSRIRNECAGDGRPSVSADDSGIRRDRNPRTRTDHRRYTIGTAASHTNYWRHIFRLGNVRSHTSGGADYQLVRSDGSVIIDAEYMIETDDHVIIHVHNVGLLALPGKDTPGYAWAAPTFAAPKGKYGWLNDAIFISHIGPAGDKDHPAVRITIYKVGP